MLINQLSGYIEFISGVGNMEIYKNPDIVLSSDDSIELLGLSRRCLNSLIRGGINTISDLLNEIASENILHVYQFGERSYDEVLRTLKQISLVSPIVSDLEVQSSISSILEEKNAIISLAENKKLIREFISYQTNFIRKLISMGLLHPNSRISGNSMSYWLTEVDELSLKDAFDLLSVIGYSINIVDELSFLLEELSLDQIILFLARYGFKGRTLESIGNELGITRERVRQKLKVISKNLQYRINIALRLRNPKLISFFPSLLKIQTAFLLGQEMGYDISFNDWKELITSKGLVGIWNNQQLNKVDPIELMIAVCNFAKENYINELVIPENLQFAYQLSISGAPRKSARIIHSLSKLHKKDLKLINRHVRFTCGVNSKWLSGELGVKHSWIKDSLLGLGFSAYNDNWFIPQLMVSAIDLGKDEVFHRSLRKMFHYCGPLSIDDICSGLRHYISRSHFPVPPPDLVEFMLPKVGYIKENEYYHWNGISNESLSRGEIIILNCIRNNGSVVHHVELAQAFIDSELSFPSLHATLRRTPIIDKIETALYKLRGSRVSIHDIERARNASEKIQANLEIDYDKKGLIKVEFTLGVLTFAHGEFFSERLPNLMGEWRCIVSGNQIGKFIVDEYRFLGLQDPIKLLGCRMGDRLVLVFNTWDRSVSINSA